MSTISGNSTDQQVASIQVQSADRPPRIYRLDDDTSLIVGRDESCGIQLKDASVSPRHCTIRMSGGFVSINDWYSENGTIVNDQPIKEEVVLGPADTVKIGCYSVLIDVSSWAVDATNDPNQAMKSPTPDPVPAEPPLEHSTGVSADQGLIISTPGDDAADENASHQPALNDEPSESFDDYEQLADSHATLLDPKDFEISCEPLSDQVNEPLSRQLADANLQIERLKQELEYQSSLQNLSDFDDVQDVMQSDEAELLRAEVEQLQSDLAQRDAELQHLLDQEPSDLPCDQSETNRLVERLEDLLDELQSADQRVLTLEDLLKISDEASQAEREERKQLESWVSEIESRIAEREQESLAREESIQRQLSVANERREQAEKSLSQVMQGHESEIQRNAERHISQLQSANKDIETELGKAREELDELNRLVKQSGVEKDELATLGDRLKQMRENELEIAKERASVARQRAELTKLNDEIEFTTKKELSADNPDVRLREFRQHLKEIHEQEQVEKRERSLSARISRIWQRLDSR